MSTKDDTNTSHPDGVSTGVDNDRGSSDNRTLLARVYQRWRIPLMCMLIRRLILRSSSYRKLQVSWNATWVNWYGKRWQT
ncbi:hypothetical protein [Nitrosomonas sp.]|uniref:hypothetical protein n=1 Tax=Nitrosomonas sp. TaxID=42353 RepID=UPI0033064D37